MTNPTDQCIEAEVLIIDTGKLWIIIDKNAVSSFVLSFDNKIGSGLGLHGAAYGFQLEYNASMVELWIAIQGHVKASSNFLSWMRRSFFFAPSFAGNREGVYKIRIVKMGCITMDMEIHFTLRLRRKTNHQNKSRKNKSSKQGHT